ncbi:BBF_HP2_G0000260.mRNA.1.CDS.1 [Saccharomyces cerevisiae]|nr:Aim2p [Saccharomyces cerevisiae YJM1307]CAI4921459.1 CGH_1_HP_G0017630.mRNA.1.CDS.1 [Saccharomyces cerevisiae]CAI4961895.1 BBT_HP_G0052170.mRNA.1.CDS.1 [Saccharomyces cerevisiae]CAI5001179.1 BBT_HP_G0081100.mRNA.1.CDS.1 [Saccharomyces cerevisiae]CAI5006625.1 BBT_HP_G0086090.mRNA.1.CDS.1 [Saccharomyces cerevisiae]
MASNQPGKCCFEGVCHDGTPKGRREEIFGLHTYAAGSTSPKEKVIVILTDVYGNKFNNVLLTADKFASAGYMVFVPDILFGDAISSDKPIDRDAWFQRHSPEVTKKIVDGFMKLLKLEYDPKFIGVVGYCFGAKFAVQHISGDGGLANAAAIAHPSFVSIEEIEAIDSKKPILISAAEEDHIFPANLRHLTEEKLKDNHATYQLDLFSGVAHGFAARGDISIPAVKYAKEKVLLDQIYWFNHFSNV